MSLPSYAIIYNGEKIVDEQFVNCGWFVNADSITRVLHEMTFPEEWEKVFLYDSYYTKEEVKIIFETEQTWKKIWKDK